MMNKKVVILLLCMFVAQCIGSSLRDSMRMEILRPGNGNGHGNSGGGNGPGNSGNNGHGNAGSSGHGNNGNHFGWHRNGSGPWTIQQSTAALNGQVKDCSSACAPDAPDGDSCYCNCLSEAELDYLAEYFECSTSI